MRANSRENFFPGTVATVDFINAVLARDRLLKRRGPFPSELDLPLTQDQLVLQDLVASSGKYFWDGETYYSPKDAIDGYKGSVLHRQHLKEVRQLKQAGYLENDIRQLLAGAVFENIGEEMYLSRLHDGVLLGKDPSFDFFRYLYPDALVIEHEFGIKSLAGVTVPDGIVVRGGGTDAPRISRFIDYSASQDKEKYWVQYAGYDSAYRQLRESSPGLIGDDFVLEYIVPHSIKDNVYPGQRREMTVEYSMLDVDARQFGHMLTDLVAPVFSEG